MWGQHLISLLEITENCCYYPVFYAETRPSVLWTGKTKCGRVLICVDGSGRVNFFKFFFNSYVSQSPVRRTAQSALQSALHVMLLSYYIGIYFMSVNATFAIAARTRKGFAKAEHMSYDRQHFDPA